MNIPITEGSSRVGLKWKLALDSFVGGGD